MGLITLEDGFVDSNIGTISFWFRYPSGTVAQSTQFNQALPGVVPLMTFGRRQSNLLGSVVSSNIAVAGNFAPPVTFLAESGIVFSIGQPALLDPSYIGLDFANLDILGNPGLTFNFQLDSIPSYQNATPTVSAAASYSEFIEPFPPPPYTATSPPPPGYIPGAVGFLGSWVISGLKYLGSPNVAADTFTVQTGRSSTPVGITPDHWHHVMCAWNFSPCVTVSVPKPISSTAAATQANSQFWYAIDDVNYNGSDNLEPNSVDGATDPQAILPVEMWGAANTPDPEETTGAIPVAAMTASESPNLACSGAPLGIPATSDFSAYIKPVDMAELFIIPNVIYDTTDDQDRRVFIDKAGKPVKQPMQTIGGVTKVKLPKGTPAVYLHGSQRWIRGQNIGTAHDFKPIGTIRKYTPDPSLHGPQGQAGTADPVKS